MFRRYRNKEIDDGMLAEAVSGFEEEITSFNVEPLGKAILKEAESSLKKYGKIQGFRTLDVLHIASFSLISERDWVFVAADDNLCKVAQLMGFKTINPLLFSKKISE